MSAGVILHQTAANPVALGGAPLLAGRRIARRIWPRVVVSVGQDYFQ